MLSWDVQKEIRFSSRYGDNWEYTDCGTIVRLQSRVQLSLGWYQYQTASGNSWLCEVNVLYMSSYSANVFPFLLLHFKFLLNGCCNPLSCRQRLPEKLRTDEAPEVSYCLHGGLRSTNASRFNIRWEKQIIRCCFVSKVNNKKKRRQ